MATTAPADKSAGKLTPRINTIAKMETGIARTEGAFNLYPSGPAMLMTMVPIFDVEVSV